MKQSRVLLICASSLALIFVFLALAMIAVPENTSAERIDVNIGNGDYYMSINSDDLAVNIDATPEGVTKTVQKTVNVNTNSATGYKLYLSMDNNDANGNRLYYNGDDTSTNYISATSDSSLSTNSWGYSTNGSSFSAVPLQGSEAVLATSNSATSGVASHNVYYGFNVNNTLPFGQYSGRVAYTAIADAAPAKTARATVENYLDDKSMADPAGGDTLHITTSLMTNISNLGTVTVQVGGTNCPVTGTSISSKYAEVMCTMPAKSAGEYSVSVTFSKFSKTYTTSITYDSNLFGVGMKKIRTMQGMTTEVCEAITTPAAFSSGTTINTNVPTGRLRDTRDANSYYVKKLADGNCWMDQNLNLDLGAPSTTVTTNSTWFLSSVDTDINYNNYKGSTSNSANRWYPDYVTQLNTGVTWDNTKARSFSFRDDADTGGDHGAGITGRYWNGVITCKGDESCYSSTGEPKNHFGNYYNWLAATAGSGKDSISTDGTNVGDSICPKGWHLPPMFGDDSFENLISTVYGITTTSTADQVIASPLRFNPTGRYNPAGGLSYAGVVTLHSSTNASATYSYFLNGDHIVLSLGAKYPKPNGWAVRCVSR